MMPYKKYDSRKLKWCNYPFSNEPLGYCWGYASFIDGDFKVKGMKVSKVTDMEKFCKGCDMKMREK